MQDVGIDCEVHIASARIAVIRNDYNSYGFVAPRDTPASVCIYINYVAQDFVELLQQSDNLFCGNHASCSVNHVTMKIVFFWGSLPYL